MLLLLSISFLVESGFLHSDFCWYLLFLLLNALYCSQMNVVRLTTILEAVEAATQNTALSLTIGLEDLVVEVGDEFSYCWSLLRVDVFAPKHGTPCRLSAAHTVEPVLDFALYLPEQILFINL